MSDVQTVVQTNEDPPRYGVTAGRAWVTWPSDLHFRYVNEPGFAEQWERNIRAHFAAMPDPFPEYVI